jgi:hypothetical protein
MRRWPDAGPCLAVYAVLTVLVWGSHAFQRTLWQDDVQHLFRVFSEPGGPAAGAFIPSANTATRRLLLVPYALALSTGAPREALQVFYGGVWLATAWLAHQLAGRFFGGRLAPLLAGALTASATSDFLTDSLVALSALWALALSFAGIAAALRWLDGGRVPWLILAIALVQVSLFTCEYAVPAVVLAPVLFWLARERRLDRRLVVGTLVWWGTAVPNFILLALFLGDSAGYAGTALPARTAGDLARRVSRLYLYNFTPWAWAFDRPQWFPPPPRLLPNGLRAAFAAAGAAAFLVAAWHRVRGAGPAIGRGSALSLAVACLAVALAANVPFAAVQFSEVYVRTHLHSRVWVALGLAGLGQHAWLSSGPSARRFGPLALAAVFIALGVWGGVERQDYFLGYSRTHKEELASILREVPALAPDATLILQAPPHTRMLATEAPYLTRAWMTLLYQDPTLECRVVLWSPGAGATCESQAEGFLCRSEISPRCVPPDAPRERRFPYGRAVLLRYEEAANAWRPRAPAPPSLALPSSASLVRAGGPTALARDLIGATAGDGR